MRTTVATDTRLLGIGGVDWWRRRGSGGRRTGSLNSRERNAAPGSLTTVDGGRYANLISRKWTSCSLGSQRACVCRDINAWNALGGEDRTASRERDGGGMRANSISLAWPARSKWACNLRIAPDDAIRWYLRKARARYSEMPLTAACAKVRCKIEICRVTGNLHVIKCTGDLWPSRSSSSCGLWRREA